MLPLLAVRTLTDRWPRLVELGPLAAWLLIYPLLLCLGHAALRANAYDLSVFDYALWSSLSGRLAYVPFIGHSLFSHHVMPTLLALLPAYALWSSPWFLIVVQCAAVIGAGLMGLAVFRILNVPTVARGALLFAFLFSRRTHSAVTGYFYVESLEPFLVLWMIWAWLRGRSWHYWIALLLALGCKEDMALYVGAFGLTLVLQREHRRRGLATVAVSAAWLVLSVLVVIPAIRQSEGLSPSYPFFEARYQTAEQTSVFEAVGRIVQPRTLGKVFNLTSSVGLLCFAAPGWFAVLVPGMLANLAARSDTMQSAFIGHYVWPLLPWLFVAGAVGLTRIWRRWPRAGMVLTAALCVITIADAPLWLSRPPGAAELATAGEIRRTLRALPDDARVWVAPNLLPHIEHRFGVHTLGSNIVPTDVDVVAFSTMGDLWPLTREALIEAARVCQQDPRVQRQPTVEPLTLLRLETSKLAEHPADGCVAALWALEGSPAP